jgi:hypothetical protein
MLSTIRAGRTRTAVTFAVLLVALVAAVSLDGRGADSSASAAFIPHEGLVPDTAKNGYPIIHGSRAEQVFAADQAGRHIVSGGSFRTIELQDGTRLSQPYFAAWHIDTRQIACANQFSFNDEVLAVEPGPSLTEVYVGGRFTKVTGSDGVERTRNKVALIDLADCSVDRTFISLGANGKVNEIVRVGDRLFLGGDFTTIGGQSVETLAELDAETGVVNPAFDFPTTGELSSRIRGMGANPEGTRLVFGGRFGTMSGNGQSIPNPTGMIDISDPDAPRLTAHRSSGYVGVHDLQDVSVSPDGTKIGLAYGTATVSDYAYLTPAIEQSTGYTWVHYMRDSSFGIGVSNNAVYVSGHFCKIDSGPGATQVMSKRLDFGCTGDFFAGGVFRTQIAALSITDGTPLTWNPGNDAGNGGRELTITTRGLLSGYDGNRTDGKRVGSLAFYDFGPGVEDTEPPENVEFSAPDAGDAVNNPAVIAGEADDNFAIVTYEVAVRSDDGRWVQPDASLGQNRHVFSVGPAGDGSFELEVFMPAGDYTAEARAVDGAGLRSPDWATRSFTQTGIEGVRPEATIAVPDRPVPVETRVLVNGTATDNVEVDRIDIEVTNTDGEWVQDDRTLDDRRNTYPYTITDGGLQQPSLGWQIDLGGLLPADTYTVTITVTDASGNTRTETDTFVATTDPPVAGEPGILSLTGFSASGGSYTMGYSFTVDEDTQLTAAGIFDANGNGTLDNPASAEIGVWRRSDQRLLWQGSIPADTAVEDGWFYTDVDAPIELDAGVEYVVGHRVFNGGEQRVNANGTAEKADGFTIVRYAYRSINGFAYPNSQGNNAVGYGTPNVKLGQPVVVVPQIAIATPLERQLNEDVITVAGAVTDNLEVAALSAQITNEAGRFLQDDGTFGTNPNFLNLTIDGINTERAEYSIEIGRLPLGTYQLAVVATDLVDNTTTKVRTFEITDVGLRAETLFTGLTGFQQSNSNYTMGYTFTVDEDSQVSELGIFDTDGDGRLDNPEDTPVGIWRRSNQQLLAQTTVDRDASAEDRFFWAPLDQPLELEAGVEYVVGARYYSGGESWAYNGRSTISEENAGFSVVRYAYISTASFRYPTTQGATTLDSLEYGIPNMRLGVEQRVVPTVTIDSPTDRQLNEDIITVAGTVTDNVEVTTVTAQLTNSAGRVLQDDGSFAATPNLLDLTIAGRNTPEATYTLTVGRLPLDTYTLDVTATDFVDNTTVATLEFTVTDVGLAAEPAIERYTPGNTSTGAYTMGYSFTVDEDSQVSGVGIFDTNGNGTLDNPADAEIGIWRRSDQQLLAKGTVDRDAEAEGRWFYGAFAEPVDLEAGEYYVVGYRQFSNGEPWAYNGSMDRVDGFTIRHYAYRSINGFAYPNSQGNNTIGYGVPNLLLGVEQKIKPVVAIDSPEDRVYFQNPVTVAGTVSDNAEVTAMSAQLVDAAGRYLQDDGSFAADVNDLNLTRAGLNSPQVSWSKNLGRLPVGDYTLIVEGVDFVGNTTTERHEFEVTDVVAEPMIVDYTNFSQTTGNYTMGYTFTVAEDAFVYELGIFDTNGNGSLDNPADTPIGIWRRSDQQLVAQATVARDTEVDDGFFWVELDDALELEAGVEYVVGYRMWSGGEPWAYNGRATLAEGNPGLAVVRYAYRSIAGFAYPSTQSGIALTNLQYGIPNMKIGVTPPVVNLPPVVQDIDAQAAVVGSAITPIQVQATDPEGAVLSFSADRLPSGVTMAADGRITGTPTVAGRLTTTVTVTDADGANSSVSFDWTVAADPDGGGGDDPCVAESQGGAVVLQWEPIQGEDDKYQVRRNGAWLAVVDFDAELTFTDANPPQGATYTIRSREGGVNTDHTCVDNGDGGGGGVPVCTRSFDGDQVTLTWDAIPGENDNYQIRVNGSWGGNVRFDAGNTWTGAGDAGDSFVVRSREGGVNTDLACG